MNGTNQTSPQAATPDGYDCDVLVIGGGPGGSTAATLLARQGWRVTLLEQAHHPRFHIGESLLPANLPLLEKLGVAGEVRAIGMEKWGAEFVSPWHGRSQMFQFGNAWDKSMPMAYQVRRSEFDHVLLRNAARSGAEVVEGCRVEGIEFLPRREGAAVRARHDDGREVTLRARFVTDASGRETFIGNQLQAKQRNRKHTSAAIYGHFTNAKRLPGKDEGCVTIVWFDHGWFWFIPLADGATSIGAVVKPEYLKTRTKPLAEFFQDTIALSPELSRRLADATLVSAPEATGNFSYSCDRTHGDNYLLIGDAFAFIDPVFSSGVMLAMQGGFFAAVAAGTCLREPRKAAAALAVFDKRIRRGPAVFSWFIYRVSHPVMRALFMQPRNVARTEEALMSVLAGDIFGETPIWGAVRLFKTLFYVSVLLRLPAALVARYRGWRGSKAMFARQSLQG